MNFSRSQQCVCSAAGGWRNFSSVEFWSAGFKIRENSYVLHNCSFWIQHSSMHVSVHFAPCCNQPVHPPPRAGNFGYHSLYWCTTCVQRLLYSPLTHIVYFLLNQSINAGNCFNGRQEFNAELGRQLACGGCEATPKPYGTQREHSSE